jgi:hypothetical protein
MEQKFSASSSNDDKWKSFNEVGQREPSADLPLVKFRDLEIGRKYAVRGFRSVKSKFNRSQKSVILMSDDFIVFLPQRFTKLEFPEITVETVYFQVVEMATTVGEDTPILKFVK